MNLDPTSLIEYGAVAVSVVGFFTVWLPRAGKKVALALPATTRLVLVEGHVWSDRAKADAFTAPLIAAGFRDVGVYHGERSPSYRIRFLVNPDASVGACICDSRVAGIDADLYSRYKGGGGITVSSRSSLIFRPRPEMRDILVPGASSGELLKILLAERRTDDLAVMDASNIIGLYEDNYSREMAWLRSRGLTRTEFARLVWYSLRGLSAKKRAR